MKVFVGTSYKHTSRPMYNNFLSQIIIFKTRPDQGTRKQFRSNKDASEGRGEDNRERLARWQTADCRLLVADCLQIIFRLFAGNFIFSAHGAIANLFSAIFSCEKQLYKRLCPSVVRSVRPSVHWSVRRSVCWSVCRFVMRFFQTANSSKFKEIQVN